MSKAFSRVRKLKNVNINTMKNIVELDLLFTPKIVDGSIEFVIDTVRRDNVTGS